MSSSSLLASKIPGEMGGDLTSWNDQPIAGETESCTCHLRNQFEEHQWSGKCLDLLNKAMVGWLAEAILITLGPVVDSLPSFACYHLEKKRHTGMRFLQNNPRKPNGK